MRKLYLAIILIGFGLLTASLISVSKEIINPQRTTASLVLNQEFGEIKKSNISILAVGDIMLDRGVEYQIVKEGNNDYRFPFLRIANNLKEADILFGNFEGPISDRGVKVGSIYSLNPTPT